MDLEEEELEEEDAEDEASGALHAIWPFRAVGRVRPQQSWPGVQGIGARRSRHFQSARPQLESHCTAPWADDEPDAAGAGAGGGGGEVVRWKRQEVTFPVFQVSC